MIELGIAIGILISLGFGIIVNTWGKSWIRSLSGEDHHILAYTADPMSGKIKTLKVKNDDDWDALWCITSPLNKDKVQSVLSKSQKDLFEKKIDKIRWKTRK